MRGKPSLCPESNDINFQISEITKEFKHIKFFQFVKDVTKMPFFLRASRASIILLLVQSFIQVRRGVSHVIATPSATFTIIRLQTLKTDAHEEVAWPWVLLCFFFC